MLPPAETMGAIEEIRRLHDPAFHRVAAHLVLLPPFEPSDASLVERLDALELPPAFPLAFGAPVVCGTSLSLAVAQGADELRELQVALARGLLPSHAALPQAPAGLRTGVHSGAAELELARRGLASLDPLAPFAVRAVSLLLEDVRGLWHEVHQKRLGPRVT